MKPRSAVILIDELLPAPARRVRRASAVRTGEEVRIELKCVRVRDLPAGAVDLAGLAGHMGAGIERADGGRDEPRRCLGRDVGTVSNNKRPGPALRRHRNVRRGCARDCLPLGPRIVRREAPLLRQGNLRHRRPPILKLGSRRLHRRGSGRLVRRREQVGGEPRRGSGHDDEQQDEHHDNTDLQALLSHGRSFLDMRCRQDQFPTGHSYVSGSLN
ncbi:MAG: hypothetical protein H0X37_20215 [Herpetosiphonaceae bacterium]|nr:hypothetical protein [Herpetosiphonaceae bacterium]